MDFVLYVLLHFWQLNQNTQKKEWSGRQWGAARKKLWFYIKHISPGSFEIYSGLQHSATWIYLCSWLCQVHFDHVFFLHDGNAKFWGCVKQTILYCSSDVSVMFYIYRTCKMFHYTPDLLGSHLSWFWFFMALSCSSTCRENEMILE